MRSSPAGARFGPLQRRSYCGGATPWRSSERPGLARRRCCGRWRVSLRRGRVESTPSAHARCASKSRGCSPGVRSRRTLRSAGADVPTISSGDEYIITSMRLVSVRWRTAVSRTCQVANAGVWRSPGRWRWERPSSWSTSRSRNSTSTVRRWSSPRSPLTRALEAPSSSVSTLWSGRVT